MDYRIDEEQEADLDDLFDTLHTVVNQAGAVAEVAAKQAALAGKIQTVRLIYADRLAERGDHAGAGAQRVLAAWPDVLRIDAVGTAWWLCLGSRGPNAISWPKPWSGGAADASQLPPARRAAGEAGEDPAAAAKRRIAELRFSHAQPDLPPLLWAAGVTATHLNRTANAGLAVKYQRRRDAEAALAVSLRLAAGVTPDRVGRQGGSPRRALARLALRSHDPLANAGRQEAMLAAWREQGLMLAHAGVGGAATDLCAWCAAELPGLLVRGTRLRQLDIADLLRGALDDAMTADFWATRRPERGQESWGGKRGQAAEARYLQYEIASGRALLFRSEVVGLAAGDRAHELLCCPRSLEE